MTPEEHNPDVAAVLKEAPCVRVAHWTPGKEKTMNSCRYGKTFRHPECALAALTAAGIACVYVPEGVEVEHGSKLVPMAKGWWPEVFAIEPPEKGDA